MHSGGGDGGGRRMQKVPDSAAGTSKKGKKAADLELDVYKDHNLLAYGGWEDLPEPWTSQMAYEHIGFAHLDRWYTPEAHADHCRTKQLTYSNITSIEIKWRFLEILRAISHETRYRSNNVPKRIAAMIYAECVLGKRVDWSTLNQPLHTHGNVGKHLGEALSSRLPVLLIPRNPVPEWFRCNSSLVDPPGKELPADRAKPKPRIRRNRDNPVSIDGALHDSGSPHGPQDVAYVAANEAIDTLKDPTHIMRAAEGLYPNQPSDHGLKMFFYNVMGWHFDSDTKTILKGLGPGPHCSSSGELALTDEEFNHLRDNVEEVPIIRSAPVDLVEDRRYHQPRLNKLALDFILNEGNEGASLPPHRAQGIEDK